MTKYREALPARLPGALRVQRGVPMVPVTNRWHEGGGALGGAGQLLAGLPPGHAARLGSPPPPATPRAGTAALPCSLANCRVCVAEEPSSHPTLIIFFPSV